LPPWSLTARDYSRHGNLGANGRRFGEQQATDYPESNRRTFGPMATPRDMPD